MAVAIKLPPFWPADPHIWFAQAEAQFATRNITRSITKFQHVVSMQPEVVTEIRDLVLNPPAEEPYERLKDALIARVTASEEKRLHQLLHEEQLGDRKPSQLLRRLQQLLGNQRMDVKMMRQLFTQRLPQHIRVVLAASDDIPLDALAQLADKMLEVSPNVAAASVSPEIQPQLSASTTSDIEQRLCRLEAAINALRLDHGSFQDRGRRGNRLHGTRSRSRSSSRSGSGYCYFHRRFGANAHKCVTGCTYRSNPHTRSSREQENELPGQSTRPATPGFDN